MIIEVWKKLLNMFVSVPISLPGTYQKPDGFQQCVSKKMLSRLGPEENFGGWERFWAQPNANMMDFRECTRRHKKEPRGDQKKYHRKRWPEWHVSRYGVEAGDKRFTDDDIQNEDKWQKIPGHSGACHRRGLRVEFSCHCAGWRRPFRVDHWSVVVDGFPSVVWNFRPNTLIVSICI